MAVHTGLLLIFFFSPVEIAGFPNGVSPSVHLLLPDNLLDKFGCLFGCEEVEEDGSSGTRTRPKQRTDHDPNIFVPDQMAEIDLVDENSFPVVSPHGSFCNQGECNGDSLVAIPHPDSNPFIVLLGEDEGNGTEMLILSDQEDQIDSRQAGLFGALLESFFKQDPKSVLSVDPSLFQTDSDSRKPGQFDKKMKAKTSSHNDGVAKRRKTATTKPPRRQNVPADNTGRTESTATLETPRSAGGFLSPRLPKEQRSRKPVQFHSNKPIGFTHNGTGKPSKPTASSNKGQRKTTQKKSSQRNKEADQKSGINAKSSTGINIRRNPNRYANSRKNRVSKTINTGTIKPSHNNIRPSVRTEKPTSKTNSSVKSSSKNRKTNTNIKHLNNKKSELPTNKKSFSNKRTNTKIIMPKKMKKVVEKSGKEMVNEKEEKEDEMDEDYDMYARGDFNNKSKDVVGDVRLLDDLFGDSQPRQAKNYRGQDQRMGRRIALADAGCSADMSCVLYDECGRDGYMKEGRQSRQFHVGGRGMLQRCSVYRAGQQLAGFCCRNNVY